MKPFTMTIGGRLEKGQTFFPVTNPATGDAFAEAPECSAEQLERAMQAARQAFDSWRRDESQRRKALADCGSAVRGAVEELAALLTAEQGKPVARAREEITWSALYLDSVASRSVPVRLLRDDEKERIEIRRKPFGVTAGIVPWNFPVLMAAWKIGQALLVGNTMVLKPSPFTPLATLRMGELLADRLPPAVPNIISGGGDLGAAMTAHPAVRKVSFTGSVATGKKVALAAASDLKHVTLELGGNDPAIVLDDVDPQKIAPRMFWSAFSNCGQVCIAIKRVYAHEKVYPGLVTALADCARRARVGKARSRTSRSVPSTIGCSSSASRPSSKTPGRQAGIWPPGEAHGRARGSSSSPRS